MQIDSFPWEAYIWCQEVALLTLAATHLRAYRCMVVEATALARLSNTAGPWPAFDSTFDSLDLRHKIISVLMFCHPALP
jgi:hypothetical protein